MASQYAGVPHSSTASKWEQTKSSSKSWLERIGAPVNKLSKKLGAEAFWPTNLDDEADKAARILRSFCVDGFVAEGAQAQQPQQSGHEHHHGHHDKQHKPKHTIPAEVIRNAQGLAIFTVMRMGLHWSGAGGSGVLLAKLPNGTWSPPSGILIHTLGVGLSAGADIYDCVCVINNAKGMEGFTRVRCTLGGEVSAAVGPVGAGSQLDSEVFKRQAPVWTYTKSKGLYLGVQIDGTIVAERTSENERFYGVPKVRNAAILHGEVPRPQRDDAGVRRLWEVLNMIEGKQYDQGMVPREGELAPGDLDVEAPRGDSEKEYRDFAPAERMDAGATV